MAAGIRVSQLSEIASLREQYRKEMNCQIIHDSIHGRPGWTREYVLEEDGTPMGYGSVAVDGPWHDKPALYEFYVQGEHRMRVFDLFATLLAACGVKTIETQSNDRMLTMMLHTFARNLRRIDPIRGRIPNFSRAGGRELSRSDGGRYRGPAATGS